MVTPTDADRSRTGQQTAERDQPDLPPVADWIVAGVLVVVGLGFVLGGSGLLAFADVDLVARLVAEGTIQSDVFSGEELVEVTVATARWGGIGLVATGVASWLAAAGFLLYRRRERSRATAGGPARGVWTNAVVGAVAAIVLSAVPFSPALGGAVAGYLQRGGRRSGAAAGGLSGLLAAVPAVAVAGFVLGGLIVGSAGVTEIGAAWFLLGVLVVALVVAVLFSAALGALGGFLADRIAGNGAEEARESDAV